VAILRKVLVERQAVSAVCEEHDLAPALFYNWQKQFFENGAAVFAKDASGEQRELERKVEHLEARLAKKDSVIAEVTGEYVKLKKELGEP
jgi:transposase-like protein